MLRELVHPSDLGTERSNSTTLSQPTQDWKPLPLGRRRNPLRTWISPTIWSYSPICCWTACLCTCSDWQGSAPSWLDYYLGPDQNPESGQFGWDKSDATCLSSIGNQVEIIESSIVNVRQFSYPTSVAPIWAETRNQANIQFVRQCLPWISDPVSH